MYTADEGRVFIESLQRGASESVKRRLSLMLTAVPRGSANGTIPLHTLLDAAWTAEEDWLVVQLLSELSVEVEIFRVAAN